MNNTTTTKRTTLTIIAIFMAATLVVGIGTLGTTTSTAFAYQQKNKGSQDNGSSTNSKNGNTVTIEECKNKGSAGGFDTAVDQECENLVCTHPGNNATCVQEGVTIPKSESTPPPTTGTLRVIKKVVCLATDPNCSLPDLCEITVAEQRTNPFITHTFECESAIGDGVLVTLQPGKFFIFEGMRAPPVFDVTVAGDCEATIAAGQHLTCTITNTERAP